jgi:hypothetical protein
LSLIGRRFALSNDRGSGVSCGEKGVFVGTVPLLERAEANGQWRPRPVSDLNVELGDCYGLQIEFNAKIGGLAAVSSALNRGDLLHAQIATLHLRIPDPPRLTKSPQTAAEIADLARQLRASGLLKADWNPAKHPHWPAGSPGGIGGEFAPAGTAPGDSTAGGPIASGDSAGEPGAPFIPAQITIPVPFELPGIPFPSEIMPPPAIPDINPRSSLRNPYPDRPECEEEWAHALEYCTQLIRNRRMRTDGYRGFGRAFQQCVLGMVREDCGGNLTS